MRIDDISGHLTEITWLESADSTNTFLRDLWQENERLAAGKTIVTLHQTAGKGRQGRAWQTPKGEALAVSTIIDPQSLINIGPGWVPLIVGSAAAIALQSLLPDQALAKIKWPNDVHLLRNSSDNTFGVKTAGILCEMLPDFSIIAGIGFNVFTPAGRLPTPRAGSLLSFGSDLGGATNFLEDGAEWIAQKLLQTLSLELEALLGLASTNPIALRERIISDSHTLGRTVRAELPGGSELIGLAIGLGEDGSLLIRDSAGSESAVTAGDVWHLRDAEVLAQMGDNS